MNLGKSLVEELGLNQSVDTLARWITHYIAEQMDNATELTEKNKGIVEKNCFEAILRLWEHRAFFPNGKNPLKNYEPIFKALEKIDPSNRVPFYFESREGLTEGELTDEVKRWLDIAESLDIAVRIMLDYIFKQAAVCATDERTQVWLENSIDITNSDDISLIFSLLKGNGPNGINSSSEELAQEKYELLSQRIKKLEAANDISQIILAGYRKELEELIREQSSEEVQ